MDNRIIICYCSYCKNEIYEGDDYVVSRESKYHIGCYILEQKGYNPFSSDETDF